jgi:hypothetical protein
MGTGKHREREPHRGVRAKKEGETGFTRRERDK